MAIDCLWEMPAHLHHHYDDAAADADADDDDGAADWALGQTPPHIHGPL